jgi:uncharacterized coiled-coil protein SlyX
MPDYDAELTRLRERVAEQDRLILALAERIAAASEVIGKNAEKKPRHRCWMAERYAGRYCGDAPK